ncbi:MAG: sensor histidine kinase [Solirubrobacteraceae bacterium]
MRLRIDLTARRLDLVVCAALLAMGLVITMLDENGNGGVLDTIVMPAAILPILLRRWAPFGATVAFAAGVVISGIPTFDQIRCGFAIPAALLILYSVSNRRPLRVAIPGAAVMLLATAFLEVTDRILKEDPLGFALFALPLLAGAWIGGLVAREREQAADQLLARTRELDLRREQTAGLAVEIERTRLASDLDTAARDGVREIVRLAAEGERDPADAPVLFSRIETMARTALNEMRGLLGVLRSDERGPRSPRPTLAQLETLLADARAGGRLIDLVVEGDRRPLPGSVELAAYRAVQHALVAVRTPATIRLRYLADALELEVAGCAAEPGASEIAVTAARERVSANGGSLTVESPPLVRWILRARLPAHA